MPRLEDKQLKCRNCHDDFLWSAGEQEFFQERGLTHQPTRCKRCREKNRKTAKMQRAPRPR